MTLDSRLNTPEGRPAQIEFFDDAEADVTLARLTLREGETAERAQARVDAVVAYLSTPESEPPTYLDEAGITALELTLP